MRKSWSAQGREAGAELLLGLVDNRPIGLKALMVDCGRSCAQERGGRAVGQLWQGVGGRFFFFECSRALRLMLPDAPLCSAAMACSTAQHWGRQQQIGRSRLASNSWSPTRIHAPDLQRQSRCRAANAPHMKQHTNYCYNTQAIKNV